MEQLGLRPKDLEPMSGKSNRVYEVLNRKQSLTIGMIRKLHAVLWADPYAERCKEMPVIAALPHSDQWLEN